MGLLKKVLHFPDLVVLEYALVVIVGLTAGAFIANKGVPPLGDLFLPLVIFTLINFGFHSFNATFDRYIDLINKPHRPIPSGVYEPREALLLSAVFYVSAIVLALQMPVVFTTLAFIDIILTISYSIPHIYLKKTAVIGTLAMALHYGFLSLLAGWSLYGQLTHAPGTIILLSTLLAFSCIITKDLENFMGDRRFEIMTLPVLMGKQHAARVAAVSMVLPYLLIPVFVVLNMLPKPTLIVAILGFWAVFLGKAIIKDRSPDNARSVFLQATLLGMFAIMFLAVTVI